MLDSFFHMVFTLHKIVFWRENVKIMSYFKQRYNGRHYV